MEISKNGLLSENYQDNDSYRKPVVYYLSSGLGACARKKKAYCSYNFPGPSVGPRPYTYQNCRDWHRR